MAEAEVEAQESSTAPVPPLLPPQVQLTDKASQHTQSAATEHLSRTDPQSSHEPERLLMPDEKRHVASQHVNVVQSEAMKGRLTVVLDLDGTLISSYTPRRAPSLPPGLSSYVVGKGAKLNPNGVLVVERPELRTFFSKLSEFAGKATTPSPSRVCEEKGMRL